MRERPVLRYFGGKWRIAPWIISHFPEHRIYTEAYGGGASVLMRKDRVYAEIYNDIDGAVVNVFKIIRDNGKELKEKIRLTPYSRDEYSYTYKNDTQDPVELARRTIMHSLMGFGADSIHRRNGFRSDSNRSGTTPAHDWKNYTDKMDIMIERLRGIVIENIDALNLIKKHDTVNTLHYIDPPYVAAARTQYGKYEHEMTDKDHVELAKILHNVKGKVCLSGYHSDLYDDLYKDWRIVEKDTVTQGSKKRIEVLWMNYEKAI